MRIIRKYKYPLTLAIIIVIIISFILIKHKLNKNKYDDIITEDIELNKIEDINWIAINLSQMLLKRPEI